MKPIDRVNLVLQGEPTSERPPFCLYPHYDLDLLAGDVLAQAIEAFVERIEPDLVAVPSCFHYTIPAKLSLDRPADLAHLEVVHGRHGSWSHQQDALRSLCRTYFGKRYVVAVVPSAYRQLEKIAGTRLAREALQEGSGFFFQALEVLNRSLQSFIKQALEAGVQGFLFEETLATHELITPELYIQRVLPLLNGLMEAAKPAWTVVQFLGRRIFWEDLALESQGLGWPIAAGPNLARGAMRWKGFCWGGLDPESWKDDSTACLRGSLRQQLGEITPRPLILATPQGLRDLRLDQIEALAHGLLRLPSAERLRETPEQLQARRAALPPRPPRKSNREDREPYLPVVREAPKPSAGARTRLHSSKALPEEEET